MGGTNEVISVVVVVVVCCCYCSCCCFLLFVGVFLRCSCGRSSCVCWLVGCCWGV